MIDGHIHIEQGDYTTDWIRRFADRAAETGLEEIRLLEHNYMFPEFAPMYDGVRAHSAFVDDWFRRKAGKKNYREYLELIRKVREGEYPVKILFGLEVCWFRGQEDFIAGLTKDRGFDFLLGSVHFVDGFRKAGCSTGSGIRTASGCSATGRRIRWQDTMSGWRRRWPGAECTRTRTAGPNGGARGPRASAWTRS